MNLAIAGGATLAILTACAFVILLFKVRRNQQDVASSFEWARNFSVSKYRPMERLLEEDDYKFLSGQPGYEPGISKKLHAERRKIFRTYLRCLTRDFDRMYSVTKVVLLHLPQDRPDIAAALLKQRLVFRYAILAVHCRLVLHAFGIGTVDVRGLVGALDSMRLRLDDLTVAFQPTAA